MTASTPRAHRAAWLVVLAGGVAALQVGKLPPALPALQAELGRRLGAVELNRYPGARIDDLRAVVESGDEIAAAAVLWATLRAGRDAAAVGEPEDVQLRDEGETQ